MTKKLKDEIETLNKHLENLSCLLVRSNRLMDEGAEN